MEERREGKTKYDKNTCLESSCAYTVCVCMHACVRVCVCVCVVTMHIWVKTKELFNPAVNGHPTL